MGLTDLLFNRNNLKIDSLDKLEEAALKWGLLPFFSNGIRGLSVQEMAAPGYLFGDEGEDCWNWKGPVIERQSTAYGKFFRRKAGFVSMSLFPDFLNYRRWKYPVKDGSVDEMVLDIIKENQGLTSTELKRIIFGKPSSMRLSADLVDPQLNTRPKRGSLEGPLQRLQMGGHLLIADFQYKLTRQGMKYGWGVALYSTPEIWFERDFKIECDPAKSFNKLVNHLSVKLPFTSKSRIIRLLE